MDEATGWDAALSWLRTRIDGAEADADAVHDADYRDNAIARGHDACNCGWPKRLRLAADVGRRILDAHGFEEYVGADSGPFRYCRTCGSGEPYEYPTAWPCGTLRLLALPFVDLPDFPEVLRLDQAETQ